MDKQAVIGFIASCGDGETLRQINDAVRVAYGNIARIKAVSFTAGSKVKFISKHGSLISGTVIKVNQKTVRVDAGMHGIWTVSGEILQSA
jgi:hypothetical protein